MPSNDLVYGRHPVQELLRASKRRLQKLWVGQGQDPAVTQEIVQRARDRGAVIEFVPRGRLDGLVRGAHHQGFVAQAEPISYGSLADFLHEHDADPSLFVLGLDELQDPQNVGAILRSAAFFGAAAVLVPKWRSAPVSEAAYRASAGGAEHLTFLRVTNVAESILQLQEARFVVWGAAMEGVPAWSARKAERMALFVGNEAEGLRRLVKERCDQLVSIPRHGKLDSLNVGAAAAALMYECLRAAPVR